MTAVVIYDQPYPAVIHFQDDDDVLVAIATSVTSLSFLDVGVPGPPGPGANRYTHNQSSPASQWVVNHNLGLYPASVRVLTPGGIEVEAEVVDMSINQLVVNLSTNATGKVLVI